MNVLLPLLVVAIGPDVPIEVRYPEAATIFHGTFDPSWDENFDGWPDHWKRRRGPGFPHYVSIKIDEDHSRQGERCLRIDLDGGAAAAYSPPIKVGPLFSYVLEGSLKTEGLRHDWAYFSITLLDAQRHRLEAFHCEKVRHSGGWKKLRLGPISPASDDARFAVIGLHIEPEGSQEDLHGAAFFDDVWLGRLPRMTLKSNHPYNFFTTSDEIEVECTVSGFTTKGPEITYQLEDESGNPLARLRRPLAVKTAVAEDQLSLESFSDEPADLIGEAGWKPPVSGPGFYRIWATMKGQALVHRQGLNLVVIDPRHGTSGGEFGWTLPRGNRPVPLPLLAPLVGQAGIHWVKYPLWCEDQGSEDQGSEDQGNEESAEDLMAFYERLDAQGIELIGLLHEPPRSVRTRCGPSPPQSAADLFTRDPSVWYPSLEPVMARLAGRVRWWQLGHDQDTSFVAHPNLTAKIAQVKNELDRIGLDVNLGIGWDWIHELPQAADGEVPWRSVSLSADPPMTPRELAGYLDASRETGLQRWVAVEPLASGGYSFEVRRRPGPADDRRQDPRCRCHLLPAAVQHGPRTDERRRHAGRTLPALANHCAVAGRGPVSRQRPATGRKPQPGFCPHQRRRDGRLERRTNRGNDLPGRGRPADRSVGP